MANIIHITNKAVTFAKFNDVLNGGTAVGFHLAVIFKSFAIRVLLILCASKMGEYIES